MNGKLRRLCAAALSLVMVCTLLPAAALASRADREARITEAEDDREILFGLQDAVNSPVVWADGTYTATGNGDAGINSVEVTITISDGKITEVTGRNLGDSDEL